MQFEEHHSFSALEPVTTISSLEKLSFTKTTVPDLTPLIGSSITKVSLKNMSPFWTKSK